MVLVVAHRTTCSTTRWGVLVCTVHAVRCFGSRGACGACGVVFCDTCSARGVCGAVFRDTCQLISVV